MQYHFEQLNTDVCKTYLFYEEDSKEAAIVDPKINYLTAYLDLLKQRCLTFNISPTLTYALCTVLP